MAEKVSRDRGYRSDTIAISRDMGPLSFGVAPDAKLFLEYYGCGCVWAVPDLRLTHSPSSWRHWKEKVGILRRFWGETAPCCSCSEAEPYHCGRYYCIHLPCKPGRQGEGPKIPRTPNPSKSAKIPKWAIPPVRLGLSGRNFGETVERPRKRSQSVSWNSPREYGWDGIPQTL